MAAIVNEEPEVESGNEAEVERSIIKKALCTVIKEPCSNKTLDGCMIIGVILGAL